MATQLPYWAQFLQALGPIAVAFVVGIAAAVLAYRQWRTARDKLRLDLFDRRMEVYLLIDDFRTRIVKKGAADYDDIAVLHRAKARSEFLFGSDVAEFIDELKEKWLSLIDATKGMEEFDEQRSAHIREKYKVLKEMFAIDGRSYKLFSQYMSFDKYKI